MKRQKGKIYSSVLWLTSEDYQFIHNLHEKSSHPNISVKQLKDMSMSSFLLAYNLEPNKETGRYEINLNTTKYGLTHNEHKILSSYADNGFKNMPSVELSSSLEKAWNRNYSYAMFTDLYQYLLSKNVCLIDMMIENNVIKSSYSTITKHFIEFLEKSSYKPVEFEHKNYISHLTEEMSKLQNNASQDYAIRLLNYITKNKECYDNESVKELIGKFVTHQKTISNSHIKKYNQLKENWKTEDFSNLIETYPLLKKFISENNTGLIKKISKINDNKIVLNCQIDMNESSRYYQASVKVVKTNFINMIYVINYYIKENESDNTNIKFTYKRSIINASIESSDMKTINMIENMLDVVSKKCQDKQLCSHFELQEIWNKQIFMMRLSENLEEKVTGKKNKL